MLGFNSEVTNEKYKIGPNYFSILSFDNIFLETDFANGMLLKGKRSGIIHSFTVDVDPSYSYIEIFRGGFQWYMMKRRLYFK